MIKNYKYNDLWFFKDEQVVYSEKNMALKPHVVPCHGDVQRHKLQKVFIQADSCCSNGSAIQLVKGSRRESRQIKPK